MNGWTRPTREPTSRGDRRAFAVSEKLAHLDAYEQACEHGDGGAYLRREGLYSSLICEWRKQRDAGVLAGRRPGERVGKIYRRAGRDRPADARRTPG